MLNLEKHIQKLNEIILEKEDLINKLNNFYSYNFAEKYIIAKNTNLIYDRNELEKHLKSILFNERVRDFATINIDINYTIIEYLERRLCIPMYSSSTLYFEYKCKYENIVIDDKEEEKLNELLLDYKIKIEGCEKKINKYNQNLQQFNSKSFFSKLFNYSVIKEIEQQVLSYTNTINSYNFNIDRIEKEINELKSKKERLHNFIEKDKEFVRLFKTEILQFLEKGYTISKKTCSGSSDKSHFVLDVNEYINSI